MVPWFTGSALVAVVVMGCASGGGGTDSGPPMGVDSGTSCAAGEMLCGGRCIDTSSSPDNCGTCANPCAPGMLCASGVCGTSCGPRRNCSGVCVDLETDRGHCGACDAACAPAEVCVASSCQSVCPRDTPTMCGDGCVDTDTDPVHCGMCDAPCASSEICNAGTCTLDCMGLTPTLCGGTCVDTDTDPSNCGGCASAGGVVCAADEECVLGACAPRCAGPLTYCASMCVDTTSDPAHCGGCAGAGGTVCVAGESCAMGVCVTSTCDSFPSADSTVVPGWTEQMGDFLISGNRLYTTAMSGAYANHATMNGSTQTDGCATLRATYGPGINLKTIGIVLRWTSPTSYVVALVQDNSGAGSGQFDSMWIYQYPGTAQLASRTGVPLGTDVNLRASISGTTVTLQVDTDRDGTYEQTLTGTTALTGPGLTGAMGLSFGMPAFVDDFCWGCP